MTEVLFQNAVNDNNYSFGFFATYTKTVAENHKFVGEAGKNTLRNMAMVCLLQVLMYLIIHGIRRYSLSKWSTCTR
jgi:hypothetical protein